MLLPKVPCTLQSAHKGAMGVAICKVGRAYTKMYVEVK